MNILKKILIVLMIALMCISYTGTIVQATGTASTSSSSGGSGWKDVNQFDSHNDSDLDSKAQDIVGAIVSVVRIVAVGVAIIMLAAVAMKYMSSAPGDRAEIKKHAVIYVVGAIVLFAGSGILTIIQNFANNI